MVSPERMVYEEGVGDGSGGGGREGVGSDIVGGEKVGVRVAYGIGEASGREGAGAQLRSSSKPRSKDHFQVRAR